MTRTMRTGIKHPSFCLSLYKPLYERFIRRIRRLGDRASHSDPLAGICYITFACSITSGIVRLYLNFRDIPNPSQRIERWPLMSRILYLKYYFFTLTFHYFNIKQINKAEVEQTPEDKTKGCDTSGTISEVAIILLPLNYIETKLGSWSERKMLTPQLTLLCTKDLLQATLLETFLVHLSPAAFRPPVWPVFPQVCPRKQPPNG